MNSLNLTKSALVDYYRETLGFEFTEGEMFPKKPSKMPSVYSTNPIGVVGE